MTVVCEVAITSGYTADKILNSKFLFHKNSVYIISVNASHLCFMLVLILLPVTYDSTV